MRESKHDEMVSHLLLRPHILGIEDKVRWSAKEVNVFRPDGVSLATQIDLLYRTDRGIYVAEYKSSDSCERRAYSQLREAEAFIKREFGEKPTNIYVHGATFAYEVIRSKR